MSSAHPQGPEEMLSRLLGQLGFWAPNPDSAMVSVRLGDLRWIMEKINEQGQKKSHS